MKKMLLLILVGVIAWVVLSIVSISRFTQSPRAYETTNKIWAPEKYNIVNISNGETLSITRVSVSGTASYVPFWQYRKHFNDEKNNIYIQTNGVVCYVAKKLVAGKEETFYTEVNYAPFKCGRSHKIKLMIGDLTIKNFYGWDYDIISKSMAIVLLCGVVLAGFYLLCYLAGKKIKSMKTKAI